LFDIVSNPEFLREGSAVRDFMHPDRIVIGYENERAREIMQFIYRVLYLNNHPFVFTGIETAEMIKYASNAFLATKITFANEIANLCEAVGADVNHVTNAMGLDGRITRYFLHPGPGYGGSCFPKDTRSLAHIGSQRGVRMSIVETVIAANEKQKMCMVNKIISAMGGVQGKTIAVLGLAFKPETDDVREAPSITIVSELVKNGAMIRAFDPIAMENARMFAFSSIDIYYANDEYDAVSGSDAVVLMTEWNQFRSLDIDLLRKLMAGCIFLDLRNMYDKRVIEEAGFIYHGVGR
jgi:UDPglucose 6-dehydrogenase